MKNLSREGEQKKSTQSHVHEKGKFLGNLVRKLNKLVASTKSLLLKKNLSELEVSKLHKEHN